MKAPKRSMADAIGMLSAESATSAASIAGEPVSKRPNGQAAKRTRVSASRDDVTARSSGPVVQFTGGIRPKRPPRAIGTDGLHTVVRKEKPHRSIYASMKAFAVIKDIANAEGVRPHDVMLEGLRMVCARYGFDFDALDRGE